jgi:hypothetical protein
MTVEISINNGQEAIALSDSRVSAGYRKSDSFDKMGVIAKEKFHSVLFGTGSGYDVKQILRGICDTPAEEIEAWASLMQRSYGTLFKKHYESFIAAKSMEISVAAKIFSNEDDKKRFIATQQEKVLKEIEADSRNNFSQFGAVGYDLSQNKIRSFWFSPMLMCENPTETLVLGSGSDGAGAYLDTKLQGIDLTKLAPAELLFFTLNAYGTSTLNHGVGGTPKIALIDKKGVTFLPSEKIRAMVNLSGAYQSEINPRALTPERVVKQLEDIMNVHDGPDYKTIARVLGINKETLTGIYIPYSSWQESANTRSYGRR